MKSRTLPNGLSSRATRCLLNAGIVVAKEAIRRALKSGKLYPFHWPPNYGAQTHAEVCRWVGLDPKMLRAPIVSGPASPYPENGLSYRANRCLARAGIPVTKDAVSRALRTGALSPGKRPSNYGPQTHAELCRWVGVEPASLHASGQHL